MNLSKILSMSQSVHPQDMSHTQFPNDLENNPRQSSRTSLHRHPHTTVCVDFDGVIASYDGYRGRGSIGRAKPEGLELLHKLHQMGYYVVVLTARQELEIVGKWLVDNGVGFAKPTNTKQSAVAYIDDRAIEWNDDISRTVRKLKDLDKAYIRHIRPGA